MGLDMSVHEIRPWEKRELNRFIVAIRKATPSINVNNLDADDEVDVDALFLKNPTIPVPYQIGLELCYWRKHPDLHGWMRDLFYEKGGSSDSSFNGDVVFLTVEDVDNLKTAVLNGTLPTTTGFFFGDSDEDRKTIDLESIDKMLEALENGSSIYYTSSW
jgi:hypothetical protein